MLFDFSFMKILIMTIKQAALLLLLLMVTCGNVAVNKDLVVSDLGTTQSPSDILVTQGSTEVEESETDQGNQLDKETLEQKVSGEGVKREVNLAQSKMEDDEDQLKSMIEVLQLDTIKSMKREIENLENERLKEKKEKEEKMKEIKRITKEYENKLKQNLKEYEENITKIAQENEDNMLQIIKQNEESVRLLNESWTIEKNSLKNKLVEKEENLTRIAKENYDNIVKITEKHKENQEKSSELCNKKEKDLNKRLNGKSLLLSYVFNILKQTENLRETRIDLIETQTWEINDKTIKYEECQKQNDQQLKIIFENNETIVKLRENTAKLQNIIQMDANLVKAYENLAKKDLSQNNCDLQSLIGSFSEALKTQKMKLDELSSLLEENEKIDEHLYNINNYHSLLQSFRSDKDDIGQSKDRSSITQKYRELISEQGRSIAMLSTLSSYAANATTGLQYKKADDGNLLAARTCSCVPEPPQDRGLMVAMVQYKCADDENSIYSLNCTTLQCETDQWPMCGDAQDMTGQDVMSHHYQECEQVEIPYINQTVNCGAGVRTEELITEVGHGAFVHRVHVPCMECYREEFQWTEWSVEGDRRVRRRGNRNIENSYQEQGNINQIFHWLNY